MKLALLIVALTGCLGSDHELFGTYETNYDSCDSGRSCVEVTACDATGAILDHGRFSDPTVEGHFAVHVPDGATGVHLLWHQHTFDGRDHVVEGVLDGPVDEDLDLGLIVVSSWPPASATPPDGVARTTTGSQPICREPTDSGPSR